MKKKLVIYTLKCPEVGKVKTRMGKDIGMEKAAFVQKEFIREFIKNKGLP